MKLSEFKIPQISYTDFGALVVLYLITSVINAGLLRQIRGNLDTVENTNDTQIAVAYELHKAVSNISLSLRKVVLVNGE